MQPEIRTNNEGPIFDLLGTRFVTKARAEEMNGAFCVVEMLLPPGAGVPLHRHPCPEFFYVLSGAVEFVWIQNRFEHWSATRVDDSILVPADVPHGLRNVSDSGARLLAVVTRRHEQFFQEAGTAGHPQLPLLGATKEEPERVVQTAGRYEMFPVQGAHLFELPVLI